MKQSYLALLAIAAALAITPAIPAHAASITDTFYGVIAASDNTGDASTKDVGDSFVLERHQDRYTQQLF
jgi:hypothetical protein